MRIEILKQFGMLAVAIGVLIGATPTAFAPATGGGGSSTHPPSHAIDENSATYWESSGTLPQYITIQFTYPLTINKAYFLVPSGFAAPQNYTWQTSPDGTVFNPAATITGNSATSRTDTFVAVSNVKYLRLNVTAMNGANPVRIATLEAPASKITSTGTVGGQSRIISGTAFADSNTSQKAYPQKDWDES